MADAQEFTYIPSQPVRSNTRAREQYKRLIICCDGTGRTSSHGEADVPTNVTRFVRALEVIAHDDNGNEVQQIVLYQAGVGTDSGGTEISKKLAVAFGNGLDIHVMEAYNFIANNYETGDSVFLFGFSRGAFTARAIAAFISKVGVLRREELHCLPRIYAKYKETRTTPASREEFARFMETQVPNNFHPDVRIQILGVFDTVGSLGIPRTWLSMFFDWIPFRKKINEKYQFQDPQIFDFQHLTTVQNAFHALGLDEHRTSFAPTLFFIPENPPPPDVSTAPDVAIKNNMQDIKVVQCWFSGVHTDVGGGYARTYRDLSDITLAWMIDQCKGMLNFDPQIEAYFRQPSPVIPKKDAKTEKPPAEHNQWGAAKEHDSQGGLYKFLGSTYRTPGEYTYDDGAIPPGKYSTNEMIHPSVRMKMIRVKGWRPPALDGFACVPDEKNPGWYKWVKRARGKSVVEIPEYQIQGGTLDASLTEPQDWQVLNDPQATATLATETRRSPPGLWDKIQNIFRK